MADDARFGGQGHDPLDAQVERAFSDAVDRQVAEQRALNQLVETAADRLAAIESGLRSLRETTSTQGVALRAELQEHVARLAEDVQERFTKLASEVDRLRQTNADQAVRLVQMARATESSLGVLESRYAGLADELERVPDDASVAAPAQQAVDAAHVAESLRDVVEDQLTGIRAQLLARMEALEERMETLPATRGAGPAGVSRGAVSAELNQLRQTFDARLDSVLARLEEAEADRGRRLDELARRMETRESLPADLAGARITKNDLDDKLAGLRNDVARTQREELTGVVEQLHRATGSFASEVDELQALVAAVVAAGSRNEEQLDVLRDEVLARIDDVLRTGVEGMRVAIHAVIDRRLGDVDERLASAEERFSGLRDDVSGWLEDAQARIDAIARDVSERLERDNARFDAAQEQLAVGQERTLEETRDRLHAVTREVTDRLDVIEDLARLADSLDDRIGGGIERAVAVARDEADDAVANVRAIAGRVSDVLDGVRQLESTLVTYLEERDRHLERQRTRIFSDLLDEFADDLSRRQRSRIGEKIRAAREAVVERFGDSDDGVGSAQIPRPSPAPTSSRRAEERTEGSPTSGSLLAELLGEDAETDVGTPADVDTDETPVIEEDEPAIDAAGGDAAGSSQPEPEGHVCPECGFVAKSGGGLASHRRTHG